MFFALCERRRVDSYGLPINEAFGGLFWNGVVAGIVAVTFVGAAMLVTGGMRIHGIALRGADLISSPLLWLVAMLLVGLTEEYVFRGYALQSLWGGSRFLARGTHHHGNLCWRPLGETARERDRYRNDFRACHCALHQRSRHWLALVGSRLACRL